MIFIIQTKANFYTDILTLTYSHSHTHTHTLNSHTRTHHSHITTGDITDVSHSINADYLLLLSFRCVFSFLFSYINVILCCSHVYTPIPVFQTLIIITVSLIQFFCTTCTRPHRQQVRSKNKKD